MRQESAPSTHTTEGRRQVEQARTTSSFRAKSTGVSLAVIGALAIFYFVRVYELL